MRAPQPEWMPRVKKGSILLNRSRRTHRVVRHASYFPNGDLRCVTLVIKHCSWTKACYTVLSYTDLNHMGYSLLEGASYVFNHKLDHKIDNCIDHSKRDRSLTCCDVEGVP